MTTISIRRVRRPRCSGFTLMEVNIALLVLAVGLIGLFSLFPVGLRQSDMATSDTVQTAFSDVVFNAMHANAAMVTNWSDWLTLTTEVPPGRLLGVAATSPADRQVSVPKYAGGTVAILADGVPHEIVSSTALTSDGYYGKGQYLKYVLHIEDDPHDSGRGYMKRAWIQITDRSHTDVTRAPVYCTAFTYMGM